MVLSASRRTFCTICIKIYHILIVVGVGGGRFDGVQPCTRAARRVASVPSSTLYQAEQHVATSDRQPATVNQQLSTSNRQPATVNQQRSTSNQQPATSNQQQAFVAMPGTSIECHYFEHLAEYAVAVCKECRYAVWPDQIEGHLQKQHKTPYKEARDVSKGIDSWSGLIRYPGELELPKCVARPTHQLPLYTDGLLCQLDPEHCKYIARSIETLKKHWRSKHGWSAGGKRG